MDASRNLRYLKLLIIATLASSLAAVTFGAAGFESRGQTSFERTLAVTGAVELEVSTGSGNINIRTGSSRAVHVRGVIQPVNHWFFGNPRYFESAFKRLESNPPILQDGNFIRIGGIDDPELRRHISISYEIEVPRATQVKAESGSGHISVIGVAGPAKVTTGSGSLNIEQVGDDLIASTGSGGIHAEAINGDVHLSTGSGSIYATGLGGTFYASTGSGDVTIQDNNAGGGKVSTGSGSVRVAGVNGSLRISTGSGGITAQGRPMGDWNLHSGSGSVVVRLPARINCSLDAHADSGRVIARRSVAVHGASHKGSLVGIVGNGGPRIRAHTGSGNIEID